MRSQAAMAVVWGMNWKAWATAPGMPLKWEIRRLFPTIGYEEKSPNTMLHIRLKELRGKIGMWALAMGWPELEAYGEPVNALRRRDVEDEALAAAEQEAWFSTKLWCVALASFHLLRKESSRHVPRRARLRRFP